MNCHMHRHAAHITIFLVFQNVIQQLKKCVVQLRPLDLGEGVQQYRGTNLRRVIRAGQMANPLVGNVDRRTPNRAAKLLSYEIAVIRRNLWEQICPIRPLREMMPQNLDGASTDEQVVTGLRFAEPLFYDFLSGGADRGEGFEGVTLQPDVRAVILR